MGFHRNAKTVSHWYRLHPTFGIVLHAKENGKITNSDYQTLNNVSKPTATRDLSELVRKKIIIMQGSGKRDTHYTLQSFEPKMSHKQPI